MTIEATDLKFYRSQIVNDTSANGGRMADTEIVGGAKNNVWPDVSQGERTAGSTKYRKTFFKVANANSLTLIGANLFVETPTPGGDRVLIFPGTQTDTQANLTGSERLYGAGTLDADVAAGATSIAVNVEAAADAIFQNGDLVRISDKVTVEASQGSAEFIRLASSNAVAWNGNKATLTFAAGQSLANAYAAATPTRVASLIEAGDIKATVDSWTISSTSGNYGGWSGSGNGPDSVSVNGLAAIEQTWTVTFTSATAFAVVGNTVGSVGTGSKAGDFSPNNASYGLPYFALPASGWGGTWAAGETLTFKSHPASVAIWQKRIIPPNTASLSGDKVVIAVSGESE